MRAGEIVSRGATSVSKSRTRVARPGVTDWPAAS